MNLASGNSSYFGLKLLILATGLQSQRNRAWPTYKRHVAIIRDDLEMILSSNSLQFGLLRALLALVLGFSAPSQGQSSRDENDLPVLDFDTPIRLDFSGSWEKDFGRSDTWEDELNRQLSIRQEQATLQRAGVRTGVAPRASLGNINLSSGASRSANTLFEMARLAEYISRQNLMEITQDREHIRIERRGEAPLICSLDWGPMSTFSSAHGTEICGWDDQQLVFQITLPDGISIQHRFTVAADGNQLRMVTSVSNNGSAPFNLIQAFNRYDAPDELNCIVTVSRGRVCSQLTPLD